MPVTITPERPDTPESMLLIAELQATLEPYYPPESRHGYSVEKLLRENVAFFLARYDDAPAGCGGVLLVGTEYAEVKRMYVRPQYRGLGVAKQVLNRLEQYSFQHGISVMRLETGIFQEAAIGLYEQMGFKRIRLLAHIEKTP